MDYTTDWIFTITANSRTVEVIWAKYVHEEAVFHRLILIEDGVELRQENNLPIVEAALAFRITELKEEYGTSSYDIYETMVLKGKIENPEWGAHKYQMEVLVALAERSFNQEFVGQRSNELLYLQDVAEVLELSMDQMWKFSEEFIEKEQLGLFGAIIIPWADYVEQKQAAEGLTGHKDFSSSDMGDWSCGYCKAEGSENNCLEPEDVECVKDAYGRYYRSC